MYRTPARPGPRAWELVPVAVDLVPVAVFVFVSTVRPCL